MLFFTFLFFLFDAVTSVTLNLREGKIEGTTKYSSIGDKSGFQMNVYIRLSDWSKVIWRHHKYKTYTRSIKVKFITAFDTVGANDGNHQKISNHWEKMITNCPQKTIFAHI